MTPSPSSQEEATLAPVARENWPLLEGAARAAIDAGVAVEHERGVAAAHIAARYVIAALTRPTPDLGDVDELVERLKSAQETRETFVRAREAMNAAIPDVLNSTPAERALHTERYHADNEAERAHYRAALGLFCDGVVAKTIDTIIALRAALDKKD
jgi:hypothetical protein